MNLSFFQLFKQIYNYTYVIINWLYNPKKYTHIYTVRISSVHTEMKGMRVHWALKPRSLSALHMWMNHTPIYYLYYLI